MRRAKHARAGARAADKFLARLKEECTQREALNESQAASEPDDETIRTINVSHNAQRWTYVSTVV